MISIGRPAAQASYGDLGNRSASQLRSQPPQNFTFDRSALRDVLRLLAEDAGIPYIGLPEHSTKAQRLVTFRMTASPFAALEAVCRQNDIRLTYDDGVWFMGVRDPNLERVRAAENANELVGVVYQLRNDPVDRVDFRPGSSSGAVGGSLGGQTTSASAPNLPLQNSQKVFEAKAPRIVNEVRVMLGMKPLQYNSDGTITDPDAMAGTEVQMSQIPPFDGVSGAAADGAPAAAAEEASSLFPVYVPPQKPQVIYNSDTNILWVVATRQQHKWVADYLVRVDKPQELIAIEVKFFETSKNPQSELGINWENTLGTGVTVRGSATANPNGTFSIGSDGNTSGSTGLSAPYSAVLNVDEVAVTMQAFMRDRDSSLVQYPRVLTINNREVAITAAENTPINAGTSTVQSGGTSSQPVGSLEYLPIGTQINILPKTVGRDQIAMTVAITVSSIIGVVPIDLGTGPNDYPITSSRVYNASLQVNSGYTLAVGGLEKVDDKNNTGGVPLLKDIPGVGYLFKNKSRNRNKVNLIIFITPYVITDPSRTPGISESPEAVIPIRPGVPPPAPTFSPDGSLLGGSGAVDGAFTWLEFQLRYFRQLNKENNVSPKFINELRSVINRARALSTDLQNQVAAGAGFAASDLVDQSARADALLFELNRTLGAMQQNLL
jgi:hypothetical protein